ncbi:MAG: hypothetical protein E7467_00205 [Ruminococcaceae bacterium]|nr:hypothetical protein [Oscillospiraceae bacterium]
MSVLADIQSALSGLDIPMETGVFTGVAPVKYIVVVPIVDTFDLHADNAPNAEVQEARISLYCQGSYTKEKNAIVKALLAAELTITERRYIGYETETGYYHYAVDVAQCYELEE